MPTHLRWHLFAELACSIGILLGLLSCLPLRLDLGLVLCLGLGFRVLRPWPGHLFRLASEGAG